MQFGWPSALGLFLSDEADSAALREFAGTRGEKLPPEVLALQAIAQKDTTSARRMLTAAEESLDSMIRRQVTAQWWSYRTPLLRSGPLSARGLRDHDQAVAGVSSRPTLLRATSIPAGGSPGGCGCSGGGLRETGPAAAPGRNTRQVLEQWADADSTLQSLVRQAQAGLLRVGGGVG